MGSRTKAQPPSDFQGKVEFEVIRRILAYQFGVDAEAIDFTTNLVSAFGADTLDIVELVMAFDEEFKTQIADDDAEQLRTVYDLLWFVIVFKERANSARERIKRL